MHNTHSSHDEDRKSDHVLMANTSQVYSVNHDARFFYEPLLNAHPNNPSPIKFLDKSLNHPFWISSMTGGYGSARHINQNLAKLCAEFKFGMGLGSCRTLLNSDLYFEDFNLRPIIGDELPFYANFGIAQIEQLIDQRQIEKVKHIVNRLACDGVIVHINPLQEWFQEEGDKIIHPPIETLKRFCESFHKKIIVKEVGQGMGPRSLEALLNLPIHAIELAGFGGTNFSYLELMRSTKKDSKMVYVGHTALEMIEFLNDLNHTKKRDIDIIISGGVSSAIDGFYLMKKLHYSSVIGMAKSFLNHADNYEELKKFTQQQVEAFNMAQTYLEVRS